MTPNAPTRGIALATLLLTTLSTPNAVADEIPAAAAPRGIVVHDAEETLRLHCATDADGVLWLRLPGGARYELVTSTSDPVIANPGDGAFHPFDAAEVRSALAAVRFPLSGIDADVFVLPYPRRNGLSSAAGRGLILLAPGVRPIARAQQHAEVVHELGHVVHRALMPDDQVERWNAWRVLRGVADPGTYSADSRHADRPHEIFAEDFRALFGGATANATGSVENSTIAHPVAVGGLDAFMLGLAGAETQPLAFAPTRNPAHGAVRFAQRGGAVAPLDLYDVTGRRLASVEPVTTASGVEWSWDGVTRGDRFTGVLFARIRGTTRSARVTLLP
jgi:hypothetical protein